MKLHERNSLKYGLFAIFGGLVFGVDAAVISGTLRFISSKFELSSMQIGTVVGAAGFGAVIALLFTGALCEIFGRKRVLLTIAMAYLVSAFLSAFATSYTVLIIGRLIGGLEFCSLSITSMYIGEIVPADKRGKFVSINQLSITFGSLISFLTNYFLVKYLAQIHWLTEANIWRYMLGSEIIFNVIWITLLLAILESSRWLIKKGRIDEARIVFKKIISEDKVEVEIKNVIKNFEIKENKINISAQLKIMFSKNMKTVMTIGLVYALVQSFSGMNAVLTYAPMIFEQVGLGVNNVFMQTIIMGVIAVLGTIVAILYVEKLGRRTLTIIGLTLVISAHTSIWFGFHEAKYHISNKSIVQLEDKKIDVSKLKSLTKITYRSHVALKKDLSKIFSKKELPLIQGDIIKSSISIKPFFVISGIFLFLLAFNISIGPIMWVIFSEVFPNSIRSVSIPFVALVLSLSSYLVQQFFPWQLENLGIANTFLSYGLFSLLGLVILFIVLPETKNKTIEEIEKQLIRE